MPDPTPSEQVENAIAKTATGPARVMTGAGTVEQQPLQDLIQTHQYLAKLSIDPFRAIRFAKLIPPSATGT
jgi:hypothetical protein